MGNKKHLVAGGETQIEVRAPLRTTRLLFCRMLGAEITLENVVVVASDHLTLDFLGRPGPSQCGLQQVHLLATTTNQ